MQKQSLDKTDSRCQYTAKVLLIFLLTASTLKVKINYHICFFANDQTCVLRHSIF